MIAPFLLPVPLMSINAYLSLPLTLSLSLPLSPSIRLDSTLRPSPLPSQTITLPSCTQLSRRWEVGGTDAAMRGVGGERGGRVIGLRNRGF